MSARRRTLLLALLALAAPLPAFAIDDQVQPAPEPIVETLEVSTSLETCGLIETQVACKLSLSFSTLENATSYSAAVTRPDGSVLDLGGVPAGGTSFWVPYVGSGSYSVRVTAYGDPKFPDGEPEVIATEESAPVGSGDGEPRAFDDSADPADGIRQTDSGESTLEPVPIEPAPTCAEPDASQTDELNPTADESAEQLDPDAEAPTAATEPQTAEDAAVADASTEGELEPAQADAATADGEPSALGAPACPTP